MSAQRGYVGTTPTISDVILDLEDRTVNLTGATVTLQYRPEDNSAPEVSISATVDPDQVGNEGGVSAILGPPIMSAPANWVMWWQVVFANSAVLDSGNFIFLVETHGPGNSTTPYMTSAKFRRVTRVKQSRLGIAVGQPNADEILEMELERAAAYVEIVTGQPATSADLPVLTTESGSLSAGVVATMIGQAIQMRTEQVTFQGQNSYVDDASDDVVSSFSVGGYSQSKSDPGRRGEIRQLNSWTALGNVLWLLMTPDRFWWWAAFLSGDASLMIGPAYSFENVIQPDYFDGWGYAYGAADLYISQIGGLGFREGIGGWQGGLGGLPGGIFPLPVD